MASYSLSERFITPKDCYRLEDPAAYDVGVVSLKRPNKYPFLSNTSRNTFVGNTIYTDKIYDVNNKPKIPNITSLKSRRPRFPYESFTEKELQDFLCRCGLDSHTESKTELENIFICQARVRKVLFKGPPPRSSTSGGLSCPSKRDRGFEILVDGSTRRLLDSAVEQCPPFYDIRVQEATEFYRGWKWSKWTSKRTVKSLEVRPGPGAYTTRREKSEKELCAEKVRAERRRESKQPRFVEIIQQRLIREGRPGPADYTPQHAKGTNMTHLGSKADRFPVSKLRQSPSPNSYYVKRVFYLPDIPDKPCHAILPDPACFGIKAQRFNYRVREGPGPTDYDTNSKLCHFQQCSKAPFGVSATRFKEHVLHDESTDSDENEEEVEKHECSNFTWQFKSTTSRFPPAKDVDTPLNQTNKRVECRSHEMQYLAPFDSSEGRLRPWKDWLPVFGSVVTPGPGYYNLDRPKCLPAFHSGPLFRSSRFPVNNYDTPAPNEYTIGEGIEVVLKTHNKRLKKNIEAKPKFHWNPPPEPRHYSPEKRELMLIEKAIMQLDVGSNDNEGSQKMLSSNEQVDQSETHGHEEEHDNRQSLETPTAENTTTVNNSTKDSNDRKTNKTIEAKPKLLRTFLYKYPQPAYF